MVNGTSNNIHCRHRRYLHHFAIVAIIANESLLSPMNRHYRQRIAVIAISANVINDSVIMTPVSLYSLWAMTPINRHSRHWRNSKGRLRT